MCVFDCTFSLGRRLMVLSGRSTLRTLRDLMTLMSFPLLLPLRSGGKQQDINMLYNENERVIRTFWKTVSIYFHHISLLDHSLSFHFTLNVEYSFNITMQQLILLYIRIICCRLICCGIFFFKQVFTGLQILWTDVFFSGHSKSITHSSKYQNCQAFSGAMPSQTSFFLFSFFFLAVLEQTREWIGNGCLC